MESYFSTTSINLVDIDVHGTMRRMINKTVTLLNYYKELPVSYTARLLQYDQKGHATFACHPAQARLIDYDRYTIVRSGDYAFKASLIDVNEPTAAHSQRQKRRFSRFLPVEIFTDQRNLLRVEYDKPINVAISFNGARFQAQMIESSATSFRIKPLPELPMENRDKGKVSFRLPLSDGAIQIEAEAMLLKKSSDNQIFCMDVSRAQETAMMKYINQRQVEIIKELNLE
ncbi:MAG TPA: hypothetical protein VIH45_11095 [Desulfuromonadaceae bacterium]